jgi:hypothetical protein
VALVCPFSAMSAETNNVALRTHEEIKGCFGDDSNEYELAGGTPTFQCKKCVRSKEPPRVKAVTV